MCLFADVKRKDFENASLNIGYHFCLKLVKINLKYKIHLIVCIKIFIHKDLFAKLFANTVFLISFLET